MDEQVGSWLFFGVLALALLFWLIAALRGSPYTVAQSLVFFVDFLLARLLWSADAPACLPVPAGRGVVIVSNHRSSVDPFFVQLSARRPVHWMVADEYCRHPFFGPFLRFTQAIPTRRSGVDMSSTKLAIRLVRAGGVVGMFPEGRINMTDAPLLPVRPGAVLVALRAQAMILPCWIEGSPYDRVPWSPFFMSAQVQVRFGRPIDLSAHFSAERDRKALAKLTQAVMREVLRLGGHDDLAPQLAGRRWMPTAEVIAADMAASRRRKG